MCVDSMSALQTLCPVSLRLEDRLAQGSEDFCVRYKGVLHFFASAQHMNTFVECPDRFTVLAAPAALPSTYLVRLSLRLFFFFFFHAFAVRVAFTVHALSLLFFILLCLSPCAFVRRSPPARPAPHSRARSHARRCA